MHSPTNMQQFRVIPSPLLHRQLPEDGATLFQTYLLPRQVQQPLIRTTWKVFDTKYNSLETLASAFWNLYLQEDVQVLHTHTGSEDHIVLFKVQLPCTLWVTNKT